MTNSIDSKIVGRIPAGLRIAAIYFILFGLLRLAAPFFDVGPHGLEFGGNIAAYKFTDHAPDDVAFGILYVLSGVGIFYGKSWARNTSLTILILDTITGTPIFAKGLGGGKSSTTTLIISFFLLVAWNGLWFWLICRRKAANQFFKSV